MKTFLRINLLIVLLILYANSLSLYAKTSEDKILELLQAHRNKMTSLSSAINMVVHNGYLMESDSYEGELIYLFPKNGDIMFRVDWMKPVREVLTMVNGGYVTYHPRVANPYTTGKLKDNKAAFLLWFLSISKPSLKQDYNFKYIGQEKIIGKIPTWHLALSPKHSDDVKVIDLWIDGNGMIIQAKIDEIENNSTIFTLSNLQKNIALDLARFKIPLRNIDIIK